MRITLDKPHTHAGKPCQKGDTIDVNVIEAEWLILRDVAHRTTAADLAQHANLIGADGDADNHGTADSADAQAGA